VFHQKQPSHRHPSLRVCGFLRTPRFFYQFLSIVPEYNVVSLVFFAKRGLHNWLFIQYISTGTRCLCSSVFLQLIIDLVLQLLSNHSEQWRQLFNPTSTDLQLTRQLMELHNVRLQAQYQFYRLQLHPQEPSHQALL